MKLKTTLLLFASAAAVHGTTTVSLTNLSAPTSGLPIVDNAGNPIGTADSRLQVGTFEQAFADSLSTLDTTTSDQAVLDAFTSAAPDLAFPINGLFNGSVEADSDGSLGLSSAPLFALISYTPAGQDPQVLVLNFGNNFPEQDALGAATFDLGRLITLEDVVFGNGDFTVAVNTDQLPAFAQTDAFSQGLTFDAIPEPSTGLLAGLAGLALVARRRR